MQSVLGMAGRGSGQTDLDDGGLTQVIDVVPIVRRSRAPVGTSGIFAGAFVVVMGAGATTEDAAIDPYNPGALIADEPWPNPVPTDLDVWLLGASGTIAAGTAANFTEAMLNVVYAATTEAWGVDEAGDPTVEAPSNFGVAVWDSQDNIAGRIVLLSEVGAAYTKIGLRLRRGNTLRASVGASNAVTVRITVTLGLFPVGLGQDAAF